MNRRQLFRQTLFGIAGAAASSAREFPEGYDASKDLSSAGWKPAFLNAHQNETLIAVSDVMIPETDTPGAKTALVNRFIDELLAAESKETQQSFLNSLAFIDGEAVSRFKGPFAQLPQASQIELMHYFAYPHSLVNWGDNQQQEDPGHKHFENLKGWIARAFWTSEPGQRALGSDGSFPHGQFEGCTHDAK
jgi:hypothetical protein